MIDKITAMRDKLRAEIDQLQIDRGYIDALIEAKAPLLAQLNELLTDTPFDLPETPDVPERQPRRNMQRVLRVELEKQGAAGMYLTEAESLLTTAFGGNIEPGRTKRSLDSLVDNKVAVQQSDGRYTLAMYATGPVLTDAAC